jgi:hypothetical protein
MSLSVISPMIMSKFLIILRRKLLECKEPDEQLFNKVKDMCGPYPTFRVYAQFSDNDIANTESYNVIKEVSDEMILKFQLGDDLTSERLALEPWSQKLWNDDIDFTTLLFKRVMDGAIEHYADSIGRVRVGIKGSYENPFSETFNEKFHVMDLMSKEINVNRNFKQNKTLCQ